MIRFDPFAIPRLKVAGQERQQPGSSVLRLPCHCLCVRPPCDHSAEVLDRAAEAVNHGLACGGRPEDRHDYHED